MQTLTRPIVFFIFSWLAFWLNVTSGGGRGLLAADNPLSPKASLIRYWNREIHNNLPKSPLILSKVSPLNALDAATFSKLAAQNALSGKLPAFCSAAKLFCFPDLSPSLENYNKDTSFVKYNNQNFSNYGSTGLAGGFNDFKNYSDGDNIPVDSFRRYGRNGSGRNESFANYAPDGNVIDQSFNSYGTGATGDKGEFNNYAHGVNVPNLVFTSYSDGANGKDQSFSSYSGDANAGDQKFTSYGKNGNGVPNNFKGYGENSNVIGSSFSNYGENGNGPLDSFTSYGFNGNVPENNFKNYDAGANGGESSFTSYRDQSNVGDDTFQSYGKGSNSETVQFNNYGKSFNEGSDTFKGYAQGATGQEVGFTTYGVNNTFKDYAKTGVSFSKYTNLSSSSSTKSAESAMKVSGSFVNRWVEPGKFFRESKLKKGSVMPMPDIRDKMPARSFLPRSITSKLPFSASNIAQLKQTFHAADNSTMETVMLDALTECERPPSPGETKRCVGSAEDMIDFATSVLGRNIAARTTDNVNGSKKNILVGSVKGINGGKVTKSVSCHQSLYPYLLYYCHSVPKVRVYEADILDPNTKSKINHGVAICHLDTSSWSPTHGSFIALGSGPGKIEVCHWIFENDLTWTIGD